MNHNFFYKTASNIYSTVPIFRVTGIWRPVQPTDSYSGFLRLYQR